MTYKEKLLDPRWQKKRLEILQEHDFSCHYCGDTKKTLHVHHFCYTKNGNPWESDNTDMIALCEDCHFIYHYKEFSNLERELIDEFVSFLPVFNKELVKKINKIIMKNIKNG